jgi:hypothetical protein
MSHQKGGNRQAYLRASNYYHLNVTAIILGGSHEEAYQ